MILEFARHKEIMSWSIDKLQFISNPILIDQKTGFATSENILRIIKGCVEALYYLHQKAGIVHRDIKP